MKKNILISSDTQSLQSSNRQNCIKTILLTGATGFLGSHLLKTLLKEKIKIIVIKRSYSNIFRISNELKNKLVKIYNIDSVDLKTIFEKNKIDIIIHCATDYGRTSFKSDLLETNLIFPIKLIEFAIQYKVYAFINTDTYYNKRKSNYSYLQEYCLSKNNLKVWLKYFANLQEIKIINMVLEHIYGPNDNINKFTEKAITEIAIKKVNKFDLTKGEQKRDFIYIDDVCNFYISAIKYLCSHSFFFKEFNVGTCKKITVHDFVNVIKQKSNSKTILNFGAIPYRMNEIMSSCANKRSLEELNLKKFITVETGISKILQEYYKENENI